MKDDEIISTLFTGFVIVTAAPIVIGGVFTLTKAVGIGVFNMVNKVKFNKKIKNGLKDGSICEFEGKYYESVIDGGDEA